MTLLLTLDDGSIRQKLVDAVDQARAAAAKETEVGGASYIGEHVGVEREDAVSASHLFEANVPGYQGWRWAVTVATSPDEAAPVTVSEVVLVPGPDALVAPAWVPWERRVQAGDLGVGDIFPTDADDPRLVPAYLYSDDPAVEEVALEVGLGRVKVLSRFGREDAATRWNDGEFGPRSDMARSAPAHCGTCGFYAPLAGALRGRFGACTNDIAPADGHVVDVEYGCGAHSEVEVEVTNSIPVAELVYDSSLLDMVEAPAQAESIETEPVDDLPVVEDAAVSVEDEAPVAEGPFVVTPEGEVAVAETVVEMPVDDAPLAEVAVADEAAAEVTVTEEPIAELTEEAIAAEPVDVEHPVDEAAVAADEPVAEEAVEAPAVEETVTTEPVAVAEATEVESTETEAEAADASDRADG
jgi:Protein of unknown function (DUF3027)